MTRQNWIVLSLFIPMAVLSSGCLDINVRTNISSDGSSERVIKVKWDKTALPYYAVPAVVDSSWTVEWRESGDTAKALKFEYTARKKFRTPEDLTREYAALPDTGTVRVRITLDKRFEWFYTYIDYSEVYSFHNLYKNVPISDYMTPDEIQAYQHGADPKLYEGKENEWSTRNQFEEAYRILLAGVEARNDPALPASLLKERKEALWQLVKGSDSTGTKNDNIAGTKKKEKESDPVMAALKKVLGTDAIRSLLPAVEKAMQLTTAKDDSMKSPDSWVNSVQMPGLILDANSSTVEGNSVTWKFKTGQIKVADYVMHAGSRVANVWAFIITGIVALLVIGMAIRSAFRPRKGASALA